MNIYSAGATVSIDVPFEWQGNPVTPTSVSYTVSDENGNVLIATQPVILAPTTDGLTAFVSTQIAALTTTQVASLTSAELSALTTDQIDDLTTTQLVSLSSTQIGQLTSTQLSGLTTTQVAALATPVTSTPSAGGLVVANIGTLSSDGMTVVMDASLNQLATGVNRGVRVVTVTMQGSFGTAVSVVRYMLQANVNTPLIVQTNSYQTYESALMVAMDMPTLTMWPSATDDQRISALITAWNRLGKLRYTLERWFLDNSNYQRRLYPRMWWDIHFLNEWSVSDFLSFPQPFLDALYRAQIIEADVILGGDVLASKRRSGIMSETIGESSMMFRSSKPLTFVVDEATLRELSGYVKFGLRSVRV